MGVQSVCKKHSLATYHLTNVSCIDFYKITVIIARNDILVLADTQKMKSDVGPGSYRVESALSTLVDTKTQSFNIRSSEAFQALLQGAAAKNGKAMQGKSPRLNNLPSQGYQITKNLVMNMKGPKLASS